MGNNFKMIARTLYGLEDVLEAELRKLGAMDIEKGVRHVSFYGDLGFLYKANLSLRTAINILKPIKDFRLFQADDLYHNVYQMPWENFIKEGQTIAINSSVHSDFFNHSQFVVYRTKDAIVDRLRDQQGNRPDVDTAKPDVKIHVHIDRKNCHISLDSSGDPLFKRSYRKATNLAPINEVLAAGILLLSGWDGKSDFLDPMCGSGTLLIEAAMIACQIPPNINRSHFSFMNWEDWNPELYELITASTLKKVRDFHFSIKGYDKDPSVVIKALENIENANLTDFIQVDIKDFFSSSKETRGPLHMVFNPPYGERLEIDIPNFYKSIGDTFKNEYPNTRAWMIVSNIEAIKNVGLRPSKKIKLYNGKLETKLVNYEIYEGSRKAKHN